MRWHISESIRTSVHLSPRAQFQPQDCWSFSAQNWFPASYFIRYVFLLPDHGGSAQPQPHWPSQTYWCTVGAVCVLLCFKSPPSSYTQTLHRVLVWFLSFSHSWIEKYSKDIWYAAIFLFEHDRISRDFMQICFNLKMLLQIFLFLHMIICYVTSHFHKGKLFFLHGRESNQIKSIFLVKVRV